MNVLKENLIRYLPTPALRYLRSVRNSSRRAIQWPAAYLHPWRRESIQQLKTYQEKYTGKRCFVIGNGPSLQKTDLSLLKYEYTFVNSRHADFTDMAIIWPFMRVYGQLGKIKGERMSVLTNMVVLNFWGMIISGGIKKWA